MAKTIVTWTGILLMTITTHLNAQEFVHDKIDVLAGSSKFMMNCLIYKPANYSSSKQYPLVLFFHGMGQAGTDINKMYESGLPKVLKDGYTPSFEFIMVAPQHNSYSLNPQHLEQVLNESISKYPNIDQSRVYLTGSSAGGNTIYVSSLNINQQLPKRFAAMVVMSGATQGINKNNFSWWGNFKTPLWAVVGEMDPSYVGQNQYVVDQVNNQVPGLASITIRPGEDHDGWDDVYNGSVKTSNNKTMWQWLHQYSRSSNGSIVVGGGSSTPANTPPSANAGADKTITLPANSVTLSGTGTDPGGSIAGYSWSKQSGPSSYQMSNANSSSTTVSNLVQGTYVFRLTVTDNNGATATDDIIVTVNATSAGGGIKTIRVNIYGGSSPYNNSEWNNWNTSASLSSSNFLYHDGSTSPIKAVLSRQNSISDNGSNYNTTMAPAQVGRHTSYSTSDRTLTISGLNNAKTYTLELYASRKGNSTNTTRFTIGSNSININTSNNYNSKASFTVKPVNGSITVSIKKLNTYNYINGFMLQESQ